MGEEGKRHKGFLRRLLGLRPKGVPKIVIFTEGKQYWHTFEGLIETLKAREVPFQIWSMDEADPALECKSPGVKTKYIGQGDAAHARLSLASADVLLATTPNIGTQGYPIHRSPMVKKMVHVFHSTGDSANYHKHALDHYDSIFLPGPFHLKSIRELEAKRNLPRKELVAGGLPYLDHLAKRRTNSPRRNSQTKTVLVGPTWDKKSCLATYGTGFIKALAQAGFRVIIRPHPQSLRWEKEFLAQVESELQVFEGVVWDKEVNGFNSMQQADLLISDGSGLRFDYAFLFERPVLTMAADAEDMADYEAADLEGTWEKDLNTKIGYALMREDLPHIVEYVEKGISNFQANDFQKLRSEMFFNWSSSHEVLADYLMGQPVPLVQES